jgi:hypothetical protein
MPIAGVGFGSKKKLYIKIDIRGFKKNLLNYLISFRTHSKNNSKSGDIVFCIAGKASFHACKKFHEACDIPIIFPKFINIGLYS